MTTVLLVDDDMEFASTLAFGLRGQGFDVVRTATGEGGVESADRDHPSVVLLDLGLPSLDGMDTLRHIRDRSSVPVIVVSARDDEPSKVHALEAGADDYVTKPFGIAELTARINAALRRGIRADGRQVIDAGTFQVDLRAQVITRDGHEIKLTATEWRLLEALVGKEGEVVEHAALLGAAWGPNAVASVEYLRVYIAALRRKLGDPPSNPQHLLTQPGVGYRFKR